MSDRGSEAITEGMEELSPMDYSSLIVMSPNDGIGYKEAEKQKEAFTR